MKTSQAVQAWAAVIAAACAVITLALQIKDRRTGA
jgi:hypothetical protein